MHAKVVYPPKPQVGAVTTGEYAWVCSAGGSPLQLHAGNTASVKAVSRTNNFFMTKL